MKPTVSVPQVCATFAMIDTPPQPLYTRATALCIPSRCARGDGRWVEDVDAAPHMPEAPDLANLVAEGREHHEQGNRGCVRASDRAGRDEASRPHAPPPWLAASRDGGRGARRPGRLPVARRRAGIRGGRGTRAGAGLAAL